MRLQNKSHCKITIMINSVNYKKQSRNCDSHIVRYNHIVKCKLSYDKQICICKKLFLFIYFFFTVGRKGLYIKIQWTNSQACCPGVRLRLSYVIT